MYIFFTILFVLIVINALLVLLSLNIIYKNNTSKTGILPYQETEVSEKKEPKDYKLYKKAV